MLEPIRHTVLNKKRIILASSSPRRKELLQKTGLKFEVVPPKCVDGKPDDFNDHVDYVKAMAYNKVVDVNKLLSNDSVKPDIIIAATKVISFGGKIFGKPKDKNEAKNYLKQLQGKPHTVYTGLAIKTEDAEIRKFVTFTRLYMVVMDEKAIQGYVDTNEPLDEAGAYGFLGFGGTFIENMEGDYFSVMGLPLNLLCKHLLDVYNCPPK